ncbi:SMP-30/gluconolactonase/LRE family protein [Streptomyces griseoruber]
MSCRSARRPPGATRGSRPSAACCWPLDAPRPWGSLVSPLLWRLVNDGRSSAGSPGRSPPRWTIPSWPGAPASPIAPDGLAWDEDGRTVWVANALRGECVRVEEGGRVLDRVATSQHTLSCLVAGDDGRTLLAATVPTDDPVRAAALSDGHIEVFRL